jgi:hypothetical protein
LHGLVQPWSGYAVRHIPEVAADVYNFSHVGLAADNRWNYQGEPTLYLASERDVALVEYARHFKVERTEGLLKKARKRKVFRFEITLGATLDLRESAVYQILSLRNFPNCFLNKNYARAVGTFLRYTTDVVAFFAPSMGFLDQLEKWTLIVFLEKLPADTRQFLPAVVEEGVFDC